MNPRFMNGKDVNRVHMRKHKNTKADPHVNQHPDVEAVARGTANNVAIAGPRLDALLKMYNINFAPGTKGLGRTHAVLTMYDDEKGKRAVIVRK